MPTDLSLHYGGSRLQMCIPIRVQVPDIQEGHVLYFGSFRNRVPIESPDSSSSDSGDSGGEPEPEEPRSPPSRAGPSGSTNPGCLPEAVLCHGLARA